MEWTGRCQCGAVQYEASGPPKSGGTCHCRDCQRWTGSAFMAFAGFPRASLQFTKGEPKYFKSSAIKERGFCPECGSSLTVRDLVQLRKGGLAGPDFVWVPLGTLDDPEAVSLCFHYGVETQLSWVHFDDDLPRTRCDEDAALIAAFRAAEEAKH